MAQRVDAHHHFWRYQEQEYSWIDEGMPVIRRDFLPDDLFHEWKDSGIDGCISVQARQSVEETDWLLELAAKHPQILGVVGWAPISSESFEPQLERIAQNSVLKGLRHVIQDEPDPEFVLRSDFNRGIDTIGRAGLVYDILIHERHLPQTIQFVDRHQEQIFVLDHAGKPKIQASEFEPWRSRIKELAQRENVYCKLSGMVTEAKWESWRDDEIAPYADVILSSFGAKRLMWGSDWPVCLLASTYDRWWKFVQQWSSGLSIDEQQRIFGGTAIEVYKL